MNHHDRIQVDPDVLVGKPVAKGTRLSVDFLLGLLALGWLESEILWNDPRLDRETCSHAGHQNVMARILMPEAVPSMPVSHQSGNSMRTSVCPGFKSIDLGFWISPPPPRGLR